MSNGLIPRLEGQPHISLLKSSSYNLGVTRILEFPIPYTLYYGARDKGKRPSFWSLNFALDQLDITRQLAYTFVLPISCLLRSKAPWSIPGLAIAKSLARLLQLNRYGECKTRYRCVVLLTSLSTQPREEIAAIISVN